MSNRVAITGLGVLSAIGSGKEAFWEALRAGRNGIRQVTRFDPLPYPTQFATQLNGFDFSFSFGGKNSALVIKKYV